jgi:two-component sensor histidine kinase
MPGHLVDSISAVELIPAADPVLEANHRIANNLSIIAGLIRSELLTLTADARPNIEYIERLLQQMSLRIDAVGRLHRLLMNTNHRGAVELCAYLREVIDAATCSLTNAEHTKIECNFEGETTVSAKQAAAIGLFVAEALVNAIKHAHPLDQSGTIRISCTQAETSLLIEIRDDGIGAPLDFAATDRPANGAGARLMRSIAHDLGAQVEFIKGSPGQIVRLELPLLAYQSCKPYPQAAE